MRVRYPSLCLLLLASAAPAHAGKKAVDDGPAGGEIVVTGQRVTYGVRSTTAATRTNTDIKDVPQAMTVVSAAQIQDQSLRSMADLVMFVPGASANSGEGNRDQIVLRGNSSTADFFIDGVRDDVQYLRDFYNIDRVEVLRGSNAMIFGRGGGGGVINRVRKVATPSSFFDGSAGVDTEGGYRLTSDVNQPLTGAIAFRLNAVYEDGNSFRHRYDSKRYGVNPAVAWRPDGATRVDLSYEHFHDRRTADRGLPSRNLRPLTGFDSVFFGDPDLSYAKVNAHTATATAERQLGAGFTIRNRLAYGEYEKFYQNVFASTAATATSLNLAGYNSSNNRKNLFNQTDLILDGSVGGIAQTFLVGAEFGHQSSRNTRLTANFPGIGGHRVASFSVPISDPTVQSGAQFTPSATDANNRTKADVAAVYVQDQIRFTPYLELVAGIRFDRFRLRVDDRRARNLDLNRTDHLVSPRIGLILKAMRNLSIYASYSRSFLPQSGDQFSGLDLNTAALKPERFDNYEIGAKWEPFAGLLATAAIYQLDRTNTRATDPADSTRIVLTGAQRSKGLELGLERSVGKRWKVSAGYAWQRAKITRATTSSLVAGKEVPLVPRHTFSLWNRFDPTAKLGLGVGVIARSKSFTTISNTVVLPGYTRVDGALFYKLTKNIQAQVNVENLFNRDYFPTANSDNNILPGAPRTLRATLRFGL